LIYHALPLSQNDIHRASPLLITTALLLHTFMYTNQKNVHMRYILVIKGFRNAWCTSAYQNVRTCLVCTKPSIGDQNLILMNFNYLK